VVFLLILAVYAFVLLRSIVLSGHWPVQVPTGPGRYWPGSVSNRNRSLSVDRINLDWDKYPELFGEYGYMYWGRLNDNFRKATPCQNDLIWLDMAENRS
jgi:hypothetical protein